MNIFRRISIDQPHRSLKTYQQLDHGIVKTQQYFTKIQTEKHKTSNNDFPTMVDELKGADGTDILRITK